jgi:predicted transcriptional regulator
VENSADPRYIQQMNQAAKDIFRRVESWPAEDQEELAELAREIEARRSGVYRLSEDEHAALAESAADARAGRFATEGEIAAIFKKARAPRA